MNQFVEFKMENFDITAHMHSKAKATPKPMTLISGWLHLSSHILTSRTLAVIQHSGKNLDSGHYIAYIRHRNHWYVFVKKTDDRPLKICQIGSSATTIASAKLVKKR